MARQYISFDDEDSPLSTSVPSSSSSTASDTASLGDSIKKSNSKNNLIQIEEERYKLPMNSAMDNKVMESVDRKDKPKLLRKLSIETSGSRDKFPTSPPELLTPITQSEVGELTPISVEINKNFESPDNSDEMLEVPTDISAILTAVESKNQEELHKKEKKISELAKENESLKEQVKKYVSAIQMLRSDDEDLNKVLEELQIESLPDYKREAKIFEKKLVQVIEFYSIFF